MACETRHVLIRNFATTRTIKMACVTSPVLFMAKICQNIMKNDYNGQFILLELNVNTKLCYQ